MKTHLPVALRKALIAAIFAVSAFAYNKAEAAVSVTPQNNVSVTETQDVEVTAVESGKEVTNFSVETDGKITVASSQGDMLNSYFKAGGDITIGDTEGAAAVLTMCGTGSTTVETAGNITVNQSVDIHVGSKVSNNGSSSNPVEEVEHIGAPVKLSAKKTISFLGNSTTLRGGSSLLSIETEGDIVFDNKIYTNVGQKVEVKATGDESTIYVNHNRSDSRTDISGHLEAKKDIFIAGAENSISGLNENRASISAGGQVHVAGNSQDDDLLFGTAISSTDIKAVQGGITIRDNAGHWYSDIKLHAEHGDIDVSGGYYVSADKSLFLADDGKIRVESENVYATDTQIKSSQNVVLKAIDGEVDIENVIVNGKDSVAISGSDATQLSGVDVDGGSIAVGSGTGATTITSSADNATTLDATGSISVKDQKIILEKNSSIDSENGDIEIVASGSDLSVTEGNVKAKQGEVTISGATATNLNGVDVDGASIAVGSETGATTITNTVDKSTTLDATGKIAVTGTTVSLTDISVDSTGTDADGVSVAITGSGVEVSGENVTGTGSVTIAGTTGTKVNGVDVDGASIAVGSETGTTTITNTDDKSTTLDATGKIAVTGTTVSLTDISVDSTGTDANGVSVAITGSDVEVSGENVTGTGSVTIAGTASTKVNGVEVDGKAVEIGVTNSETTISGGMVDGADGVKVNGSTVQVNNNASIDAEGGDVAINGTDTGITGGNVTSTTGDVDIIGSTTNTLSGVSVGGKDVSVTGGEVSVTNGTVAGTAAVTIAGTTSTVVNGVDVDGKTVEMGSSDSETTITGGTIDGADGVKVNGSTVQVNNNASIDAEGGDVAINGTDTGITGGNVTSTTGDVDIIGSTTNTLSGVSVGGKDVSVTGGEVSVTNGTVAGTAAVTIAGTASTNVNGVVVDGSSIAVGSETSTTTITNTVDKSTTLDATGKIAVTGTTVSLTDISVDSTGTDANGVSVAITGSDVEVSGENVTGTGSVTIAGSTSTAVNGVDVDGKTVAVGDAGSVTTITGGTVDGDGDVSVYGTELTVKDGVSIDSQDGKVTVSGATTGITGGNVTSAAGEVDIIGSTTNTLSGVSVGGKEVSVTGGAVSVTGGTVAGTEAVAIAGTTSTEVNGVDVDGASIAVGSETSTTTITNTDDKDTTLDATGKIAVTGTTVSLTDISVDSTGTDANGVSVAITGSDVDVSGENVTGTGSVTIAGTTSTEVNGVDVDGKTVEVGASNSGTAIDGGTIDGAAGVKVNGETVFVNNNAVIKANDGDVSLNAGTVNYVDSGTSITAESGGVAIALAPATGAVNIVTGAIVENDIVVSTAPVSITAGGGALVIDGGVSGDNLIDYATMTAAGTAGSITIKGKTNAIGAAVTLHAAVGITVSSLGTDALSGNKVDASTLVSAGGDIALDANYANHVSNGTVINAESGGVKIALTSDSGFANIVSGATDTAPNPVSITAGDGALMVDGGVSGENLVEYAKLTAGGEGGIITIQGKANGVGVGATLLADKGVNIVSTGTDTDASDSSFDGNLVHASSITAKEGNVAVGAKSINRVIDADLVASAGAVDVSGHTNLVQAESTIQASEDISVTSTGDAAGSGNYLEHSSLKTSVGSVEIIAEQSNVVSNGSTVHANQDIDIISFGIGDNHGNVIKSSTLESDAGDVKITAANINQVEASKITASDGAVELNGDSNLIYNGATVQAATDVSMTSSGVDAKDGNQVSNSTVKTSDGDVVMTSNQFNAVINADISTGYMEGKGDIIIGDEDGSTETVTNGIVATEGHNTSIFAGRDVRIAGSNVIMGSNFGAVTIAAAQGDITLRDDNDITCAVIDAAGTDGDVAITTGTGDKGTTITNSGLYGQTVTIAGDTTDRSDDNLALVTGENTRIASRADAGVGLTLNNVFVRDTEKGNTNIFVKTQSDIAILNRVDLQNGTLTIKQGAASDGRIVVDAGNVLNARAASSLEGRLTGAGDINKSGGDSLLLDYDHSEFTGSIYANGAVGGGNGSLVDDPAANAGSWIEISGAGVGVDASIVLKNTDLVISTDKTRIGTLDTTQDSDVNEKGTGDTLLTDGSYTADGNERTDFTTVGSVLEVNKGKAGDVVQASDMKLSDATLIKLDAEVNGAEVKADTINAAGIINAAAVTGLNSTSTAAAPNTARVYIRHADLAAASNAAEGARTTIMTGTMAADINEDVLYDVALSDNGTYQRTLQDRNVHLENMVDRVDLVYSKNYRSAAKDANLNQVADALRELSDSFHHTEGTLASSSDTMKRLVDAFDYTRSEEAALRGLRSVAGTGNVLPRLMQFDSSRRHLSALRQQMEMPVCKYAWKGALNRTNNVWMSYTGAYDNLSGDSNMGDYSRNAHGAIVGVDRSLSCKLRVGLSLGYETSTGKADDSKVDADTFFVDAYATGVTGQLKHRASVGLAASSFEYDRNVLVEAGYHTFNGLVKGETDGLTLNFGYELSSDYHFSERSRMNRYLAVNLAWHQLDSVKEDGLGNVGLTTEFEDEWQADLALGVNYIREFAALRNQKLASFYANAAVHLELLNDQVTATNRLGDTGAGWQTSSMERSPLYFELGAGVVVPLSPTWTGTAGATFEIGPDRYGFSGGVGARYSF